MFEETVGRAVVELAFKGHAQQELEATRKKLAETEAQANKTGQAMNRAAAGPPPSALPSAPPPTASPRQAATPPRPFVGPPVPTLADRRLEGMLSDTERTRRRGAEADADRTLWQSPAGRASAQSTARADSSSGLADLQRQVAQQRARADYARTPGGAASLREQVALERQLQMFTKDIESARVAARPFGERLAATGREALAMGGGVLAAVYALGKMVEIASPQTWNTFTGHLQLLASTIGSKLIPVFNSLSAAIEDVDDWLRDTFKSNEEGKPWDDPRTGGFWGNLGGGAKDVVMSQINPQNWIGNALTGGTFGIQKALGSRAAAAAGVPGAERFHDEAVGAREPRLKAALMPGLPPAQVSAPEEYGNRLLVAALNKDDIQTELMRRTAEATEDIARAAAGRGGQGQQPPPAWR